MDITTLSHFFNSAHQYHSDALNVRNTMLAQHQIRDAAVLVGVVYRHSGWCIMLTRRADTLRHHTGQIAFAGGRFDPTDSDLTYTALRETQEETGISPCNWQTFTPLNAYYTPTGYAVTPIPAICPSFPSFQANPQEVAEIFFLPIELAFNPKHYTFRPSNYKDQVIHLPSLSYLEYDIWGLTASILFDLAQHYQAYL